MSQTLFQNPHFGKIKHKLDVLLINFKASCTNAFDLQFEQYKYIYKEFSFDSGSGIDLGSWAFSGTLLDVRLAGCLLSQRILHVMVHQTPSSSRSIWLIAIVPAMYWAHSFRGGVPCRTTLQAWD